MQACGKRNGLQDLLENVIADVFPKTPLQRCTTHLKRAIISDVRMGDKRDVAEDLKQVFRTRDRNHTVGKARPASAVAENYERMEN